MLTHRGRQGIGSRLLQTAERLAHQQHYPKIALHLALSNRTALDRYARLHCVVMRQTTLYHRPYVRMVKSLEDGDQLDPRTGRAERTDSSSD